MSVPVQFSAAVIGSSPSRSRYFKYREPFSFSDKNCKTAERYATVLLAPIPMDACLRSGGCSTATHHTATFSSYRAVSQIAGDGSDGIWNILKKLFPAG